VPEFLNLQTLVNELPGAKTELSGTFRLLTNSMRSQVLLGVGVRVGLGVNVYVGVKVNVNVGVGVLVGANVCEGVTEAVAVEVDVFVG